MKKNVKLALVIPQKCTFLANKLLKAWEMLNFWLVILKKTIFQFVIVKREKKYSVVSQESAKGQIETPVFFK